MAELMLALLVDHRVITAATRLRDGRNRDGSGRRQHGEASCVSGMHCWSRRPDQVLTGWRGRINTTAW